MSEPAPIGLLGGSFDPIHIGHLQLARDALAQLALSQVRFLPAGQPWQKGEITAAAHRAHMVELALRDLDNAVPSPFVLDMHEIERAGPTFTIDTLRELRATQDAVRPLVLIMGSDQFEQLDTWRDWTRLLYYAHLAVARRADAVLTPNYALQEFFNAHWARPAAVRSAPCGRIVEFAMTPVDASATEIRALLAQRKCARTRRPAGRPRSGIGARLYSDPSPRTGGTGWTFENCNDWSSTRSKTSRRMTSRSSTRPT